MIWCWGDSLLLFLVNGAPRLKIVHDWLSGRIKEDLRTPLRVSWLWANIMSLLSRGESLFTPSFRSLFRSPEYKIFGFPLSLRILWLLKYRCGRIRGAGATESPDPQALGPSYLLHSNLVSHNLILRCCDSTDAAQVQKVFPHKKWN